MPLVAACALLGQGYDAAALEVLEIETDHRRGEFSVAARMVLDARPSEVWAILIDLERLDRIDRAVVLSHRVGTDDDGNPIVHQRFCGCVSFLCKRIDKTDAYDFQGSDRIEAHSVAGVSNLERSHQTWQLTARPDGRTEMAFTWVLDPEFWVPPLIGTWALSRSLAYVVPRMGSNIEYWAAVDADRIPTAPPPGPVRERCREVGADEH
jgi:hypothetical protein